MSLLTIVQKACAELAINQPTSVISNADPTVVQLLRLAQRAGDELARDHDWSILRVTRTFTCTGAMPEPTEPPSDFQTIADESGVWNVSRLWRLNGPVAPDIWQRNIVFNANPVPQIYRLFGGNLDIYPNNAGESITYEYISKNWITLAGGGTGASWVSDSDTARIPERVLELSLIWRWKQAKGLEASVERDAYQMAKENEIASDRIATPFNLALPSRSSAPANYWPGVVTVV